MDVRVWVTLRLGLLVYSSRVFAFSEIINYCHYYWLVINSWGLSLFCACAALCGSVVKEKVMAEVANLLFIES